jgi:hypothetical protein
MAKTPIRDVVIWAKHIHGDGELLANLEALQGGETIDLIVDGVRGVWRKMADGKDGRSTSGIRPVGAAQTFWKELYASRRGDVVDVELAPRAPAIRSILQPPPGTEEQQLAALEKFFEFCREDRSSDGRTVTRDEMHEH